MATSTETSECEVDGTQNLNRILKEPKVMPNQENQSSEEIQIPPIPKETAGAVTGAAIGSVAGPIGAVVGGVVGALAGKAAASGRPIIPVARKTVRRTVKKAKAVAGTAKRKKTKKSRSRTKKSVRGR